jgi:hypothetical protein
VSKSYEDKCLDSLFLKLNSPPSIVIQWDTGRLEIPYKELLTCSKRRLRKIICFAMKHGGWKLINHNEESKL